jgi:signal transduction histidine kinase
MSAARLCSLMLLTDLDAQQKEYACAIQSSSNSLLVLINDILDVAKIEAGKFKIRPAPCDAAALLTDVRSYLQAVLLNDPDRHVAFEVDQPGPLWVVANRVRLRQVLFNLTSNAVKFTHAGSILVTMRVVRRVGEDMELRFSVADTGIGIRASDRNMIFKTFSQLDVSDHHGGTGLGLIISKSLVEMMGGENWIRQRARDKIDLLVLRGGTPCPRSAGRGPPAGGCSSWDPIHPRRGRQFDQLEDHLKDAEWLGGDGRYRDQWAGRCGEDYQEGVRPYIHGRQHAKDGRV